MAKLRPLGRITVSAAGTPVRATNNQSDPAARFAAHSILFQRDLNTETGDIYILSNSLPADKTGTDANVIVVLPAPSAGPPGVLPHLTVPYDSAPNAYNAADFWIDAETSGDGCIVTVVRG